MKNENGKINFNGIIFNKEQKYFSLADKPYPIIKDESLISDPNGPKTNHEYYSFGYVQKERVIPQAWTEFFSRFVNDNLFNGKRVIYFSEGSFSPTPTSEFFVINDEKTGEIIGTTGAIFSVMKKYVDDYGKIEYSKLQFEYLKFLLSVGGDAYSSMFKYSEDGITYYYGNVRLEGGRVVAEIESTEKDSDGEEEPVDDVLDNESVLYALSSTKVIGQRLVLEIGKVLLSFKEEVSKSATN